MKNTVSFIQVAQLKDELSDAYKVIDLVAQERDKAISDKDLAVAQAVQEYKDEISRMKDAHQREIEQMTTMHRFEISQVNDSHKNAMIAKELELQRLRDSNGTIAETSRKTIEDITSKTAKLEASLSQNISQTLWYRQRYWGKDSEQARLLQNRHPLTRREEKALFMQNVAPEEHQDNTSELDTTRRKSKKSKKLRLDYSKNKPYTDHPVYIKLEDYYFLSEGESYKKRNGVIEKRLKRMVVMVPAHFEEIFIEVATVRCKGEERDTYVLEEQVIPGVPFDAEMISFILTEHYCFNTTWANIAKKLEYYGVHISDSTLGDIAHRCISYMKKEMEEVWKNELYATNYWMIDETTGLVGIMDEKTKERSYLTEYMWGIRANLLKLSWFINKIKKLFAIDAECKEHGIVGEERAKIRVCSSSFIMQEIENKFNFYINSGSFHKLGKLTQAALKYIKNEWPAMKNVLTFGDAELSNNLCEQMMRHIKTNLKNSQNIGSEDAAGNFCFMYSLVESCGFNALSPIGYISHLLKALPTLGTTAERRNLLPCYCQL